MQITKFFMWLCITFTLTGCGAEPSRIQARALPRGAQNDVAEPGDALEALETSEDTRAQIIADAVLRLPNVAAATAVITGSTAIVGISVAGDLEDARLIALKHDAELAAMAADSSVTHVAVSAAFDSFRRIIDMPGSAHAGPELPPADENELLMRIVPTV